MINWKQKLASRKFWAAVAGLITALLALFKVDADVIVQVAGVIGACGVLATYIFVEGQADAERIKHHDEG